VSETSERWNFNDFPLCLLLSFHKLWGRTAPRIVGTSSLIGSFAVTITNANIHNHIR